MFRRQVFDEVGGYGRSGGRWEDQDFFLRLATKGTVYVIPDVLYHYRYHVNSTSLKNAGPDRHSLYSTGALRLWAGYSPAVLKQLITQRALRLDPESIRILIWASWGELNPASLRATLRALIRTRDLMASAMVRSGRPCEWRSEQS
jgi:GT2 family glycosyltransferase